MSLQFSATVPVNFLPSLEIDPVYLAFFSTVRSISEVSTAPRASSYRSNLSLGTIELYRLYTDIVYAVFYV